MRRDEVRRLYFKWMENIIANDEYTNGESYELLLQHLHRTDFVAKMDMDDNRASDGIDLRYRFRNAGIKGGKRIEELLDGECSIFEMMVALGLRCEENIMGDPFYGDRTGVWFWTMIESLGLMSMNDVNYDERIVEDVLYIFLTRNYCSDGSGGLFTIKHCARDLRKIEIWTQMFWYLNKDKPHMEVIYV